MGSEWGIERPPPYALKCANFNIKHCDVSVCHSEGLFYLSVDSLLCAEQLNFPEK